MLRLATIVLCLLVPSGVHAATGTIQGRVLDAAGEPLEWAAVEILELSDGVLADERGRYRILDLPAGTYTLRFQHMRAEAHTQKVTVIPGQVVRVSPRLVEFIPETETYEFTAERDDLREVETDTRRVLRIEDHEKIRPIDTVAEAISTQPGVSLLDGEIHVHGGRSGETKTLVGGLTASDSFAGSSNALEVSLFSVEVASLLSGGFDAEYGNALSGIVDIETKEGGDTYDGRFKYVTDDFGAPERTYFNYDNIALGFGGPVPFTQDRVRFFVSGEGVFQDTYLRTGEQRTARKLTFGERELASLRDRQENAMRAQAKLTFRFPEARKLSAEALFSRSDDDWYHHVFSRRGYWSEAKNHWWFERIDSTYTYFDGPSHVSDRATQGRQFQLIYSHPLSVDAYFKLRAGLFQTRYKEGVGDKRPEEYVPFEGGDEDRDPENLFYAIGGDFPVWERRSSDQITLRADYQNKLGDSEDVETYHELKTGVVLDHYALAKDARLYPSEDEPLGTALNRYSQRALGGAAYFRDRLRYRRSLVVNAGLRLDWFDPGADAIRASNHRLLGLDKPVGGVAFLERLKTQISPRLGMSYPITDRDVLHFHYGRTFQLPNLELLYDFSNNADPGRQQVGNAYLDPETTIAYQFGVRRQIAETLYADATIFFKDIFGWLGTEVLEAEAETEDDPFAPITFVNQDYGSVRGFELSLQRQFADAWQGGLSYTLSRATGSSSDINQGDVVAGEGQDREPIREVPLAWDRTHILSAHLYFADPGVWGLNFDFSAASGAPVTPLRLGQRAIRAEDIGTLRLPSTVSLSMRGNKQYALYGREFRLFLEGRNLLDRRNVRDHWPRLFPAPSSEYYRQYFTEFGELGGAYNLADTAGAPDDVLVPLDDPRVYGEPRVFRMGVQFEW